MQAETITNSYFKMIKFCLMMKGECAIDGTKSQRKTSVLIMDALYGIKSYSLCKSLGFRQKIIENTHQPSHLRREFDFQNWEREEFIDMIIEDLKGGKNIVVVTLSRAIGARIIQRAEKECEGMGEITDDEGSDDEDVIPLASRSKNSKKARKKKPEGPRRILFYHSKMSDERRKDLSDVNRIWNDARLLVYSPSVESGKNNPILCLVSLFYSYS